MRQYIFDFNQSMQPMTNLLQFENEIQNEDYSTFQEKSSKFCMDISKMYGELNFIPTFEGIKSENKKITGNQTRRLQNF